ncbi:MAG: outer membrane protein transport protein [Rhodospirillales bacterium]|nr:outer membrane protein transport protein [Rhodospirillales bacterium]
MSVLALGAASQADAAGFYIKEMSVTGLGRAFAGAPVAADDASTVWFNPAGMNSLKQNEAAANLHIISPKAELTDTGSQKHNGVTFQPLNDPNTYQPYEPTPIPNLFGVLRDVDRGFSFGVGVTAPFGLANDYPETWFGRFDSIKTELETINYSLVAAFDLNKHITIGAGIDYQTVNVILTSMKNQLGVGELHSKLEGDDGTFGFNVGMLAKITPDTQAGLTYRTGFTHDVEGTATVRSGSSTGTIQSEYAAQADLGLPALASFGIKHRLNDQVTVLGDVSYYKWSAFDAIKVYRVSDGALREDIIQNYRDTVSFGLGMDYVFDDALTLRAGVQYDPTPTRDGYRTSRTPDGDRTWISGGLTYRFSDSILVDAALTYIHIGESAIDVNRSPLAGTSTTAIVNADIDGSVVIGAVGFRYQF